MNLYRLKFFAKIAILFTALSIIVGTMIYNNNLATKLSEEEKKRMEIYSVTQKLFTTTNKKPNYENLVQKILRSNTTIPLIIVDEKDSILIDNLDRFHNNINAEHKAEHLKNMKEGFEPITINVTDEIKQYMYFQESELLHQLRNYPYIQLLTMGIFLMISYLAFSTARRSEQDRVWVGMARETAHQLGTPLSSLTGWLDNLKAEEDEYITSIAEEMEKDTARLNLIAERFSKIGSKPKLKEHELIESLKQTYNYVKRRAGKRITFSNNFGEFINLKLHFSPPLLDWVIENLLKNALDAMKKQNEGNIQIILKDKGDKIQIDVCDTGCGIPLTRKNDVFKPGYSSKERGWGLGLSLSKRIIEEYHKGEIFVHKSSVDKGTTFRILLPK